MNGVARTRRAHGGVTLLELLFSLGLLALLAGLAAPGFRVSLRESAVRSAAFDLAAGLEQTRAHAILESRPALLCPADSSGNCLASGAAAGWRAFLEVGSARQALGGQGLPAGVALWSNRPLIRFWPDSAIASAGTLTICDEQRVARPRAIVISVTGRARMAIGEAAACRI
jgi:type IV fimbrial biogenesis protein FimT